MKTSKAAGSARALPGSGRRDIAIAAALALITLLLYLPVRHHDFVNYDDDVYLYGNERVAQGITAGNIHWAFTGVYELGNWDPLHWLSHMLVAEAFGLEPAAHHLASVILHLGSVALLFLALRRMTGSPWQSAFVAALFAWHPNQVETVAWAAERKGALSGMFWMLTLWLYARYAERPGRARYLACLASFVLGLMSKPMLLTLPFVLLLLDLWPLRRWRPSDPGDSPGRAFNGLGGLIREKLPFFVIVLVWFFVAHGAQSAVGAVARESVMPLEARLANAPVSYIRYLGAFFWPSGLTVYYPHPGGWAWWRVGLAGAILAAGLAVAWTQARRRPFLTVGWLWFLGVMVPVIQLVQIGTHSMADRYFYLPLVGVAIVVGWGAAAAPLPPRTRPRILAAAAAAVLLVCLALTSRQIGHWRNTETLFTHALRVDPENHVAHNNLGVHDLDRGRFAEAAAHFAESARIRPEQPQAHFNLGVALAKAGRREEAIARYRTATELDATYAKAHANLGEALAGQGLLEEAAASYQASLALDPDDPLTLNNLGNVTLKQGRLDQAIRHYEAAARLDEASAKTFYNLGRALQIGRQPERAARHLRRSVELDPESAPAWNNLANALVDLGRLTEAIEAYESALRLDRDFFEARVNYAMTLEDVGASERAAGHYAEALRLRPDDPRLHALHGGALTAAGRVKAAAVAYRRALELKPDAPDALNGLARILASAPDAEDRDAVAALRHARRACQLTGRRRADYLDTLAAAIAEGGDFDAAAKTAEAAAELARENGRGELAGEISARAESYRAGRPFRLPRP